MLKKIKKFVTDRDTYYPNIQIFTYYLLKAIKKSLIKAKFINSAKLNRDMFDWPLYYLHYQGELKKSGKQYVQSLKIGDYGFVGVKLIKKNLSVKPLHPSHHFLYETIMQLNPQSVFEMGCGTGMHLHNLQTLLPQGRICGIDLSNQQLSNLKKAYPHLADKVKQADATIHFTKIPFEVCDLAFTQAVIMHIHTDNMHLIALENLFAMSKKYVILMEKITNHDYVNDIKKLFNAGKIKWSNLYFYYRINEESSKPNGIICSSTPLNYPELTGPNVFSF